MTDEKEWLDLLDDPDLWVRGEVYVRHRREQAAREDRVSALETQIARFRYEHDILQRIQDKITDPQVREQWEAKAAEIQAALPQFEQELATANARIAYHQAMIEEIEADLGEKAEPYRQALEMFEWLGEDEEYDEDDYEDDYEDEEWSDEFECLECGAIIREDQDACPRCGWTWETDDEEEIPV